jgi:hypothetical protein
MRLEVRPGVRAGRIELSVGPRGRPREPELQDSKAQPAEQQGANSAAHGATRVPRHALFLTSGPAAA